MKYEVVYPAIAKWMRDRELSKEAFSRLLNNGRRSDCGRWLNGFGEPGMATIRAVLKVTGMKFEEAFWEEDEK